MKIPNQLTRTLGRQFLVAKKHSPHITFGLGLVGVVTSTVLACRATMKLGDTLDKIETEVNGIKTLAHSTDAAEKALPAVVEYRDRDLAYTYIRGTVSVVKLYAPSVLIGAASIGALTGSHVVLARRNAALTAAYAALSRAYDDYRNRVRNEVGKDRELELYHGATWEQIEKDGKKELVSVVDPLIGSPYARFFDEYNKHWVKNGESNQCFVTHNQNYFNHILNTRGHVFLNEVYEQMGFEHTKAGAVVGWIKGNGDNYIDFGMYEAKNVNFLNGYERSILLDFNVDGIIYDKI